MSKSAMSFVERVRGSASLDNLLSIKGGLEDLGLTLEPARTYGLQELGQIDNFITEAKNSNLETPSFINTVQQQLLSAREQLAASSPGREDLLQRFDETVLSPAQKMKDFLLDPESDKIGFAKKFGATCKSTHEILEGIQGILAHEKEGEEKKEKSTTAKVLQIAATVIIGAFLLHFGIPTEMIILAASGIKHLCEKRDPKVKLTDQVKPLVNQLLHNPEFRKHVSEQAVNQIESVSSEFAAKIGLRDKIDNANTLLEHAGNAKTILQAAKKVVVEIPELVRNPESTQKKLFANFKTILEETIKPHNAELYDKMVSQLDNIQAKNLVKFKENTQELSASVKDSPNLITKIKALGKFGSNMKELVEDIKEKTEGLATTEEEKKLLASTFTLFKGYAATKYVKPAHDLCEVAIKHSSSDLAKKLGLDLEKLTPIRNFLKGLMPEQAPVISR